MEKAREAFTDETNLRSIYAECSADVLTQTVAGNNGKAESSDGYISWTVSDDGVVTHPTGKYTMKQQKAGLAAGDTASIDIVIQNYFC